MLLASNSALAPHTLYHPPCFCKCRCAGSLPDLPTSGCDRSFALSLRIAKKGNANTANLQNCRQLQFDRCDDRIAKSYLSTGFPGARTMLSRQVALFEGLPRCTCAIVISMTCTILASRAHRGPAKMHLRDSRFALSFVSLSAAVKRNHWPIRSGSKQSRT